MNDETALRERWGAAGQAQVFDHWGALDAAGRERLLAQLGHFDPEPLAPAAAAAMSPRAVDPATLEPPEPAFGPEDPGQAALAEAGAAELAAGRVAVLTVAGGQGTRLGFDGPKGAFPIGPVSDRSLFGLFAQRMAGLARRHGRMPPWLVMTSPATDGPTRAFFAAQDFFGLDREQVRFVVQGTLPAVGLDGRVLLAAPDRVAEAPDGHGGVFAALLSSGALADLEARGIERVFYHHVDNPLARLADPAFLGLHAVRGAEMSCKAVEKLDPLESMGFLCRRAGQTAVIEYSEIPPEVAAAQAPSGAGLRYRLGSVGIHVFERSFLERVAQGPALPLHGAQKPIRALDAKGRLGTVEGWKLERFVFDALARARVVALMESRRADEYSPVKNLLGEASPATARRDLNASYRRWLTEAGLQAPGDGPETELLIEMDHTRIDGPNDLRRSEFRPITDAAPWIRIAKGAER
ncbi:MAG: UTP--glucose-1-phosphate uridylyltransferase [Deltaproteobacteria bacterium]|nr:UTP--glucose-1-phosphate uridylyltransferase [Deltaproteobacteria bacterium]MBW2447147.1 UTP--glucose-1-phosphate uridylyltransferase [Deltaproteobacteria bacterium]